MKKFLVLLIVALGLAACSGSGDQAGNGDQDTLVTPEMKTDAAASDEILQESQTLDAEADSLLNSI